ncbi:primosomal protein N' [Synechococcus sp. PCC 6312]|uniref:primosomal protein N' n=1 Tax=Synechococcus sp. (strain ATCC 27167 / PCC 6312) TaxID=195253 RepID=UPI00029EF947|nr:primosomal protein N' [Synechococcus sp. PCC 6312]AFY61586.1 replication restart DNA helicase PriA [Synechococcus sp. PCC 6312]
MPSAPWLNVLLDCPGNPGAFTYAQPPDLIIHPGDLVSVPFGSGQMGGIVIGLLEQLPPDLLPEQVRPIIEVIQRRFFSLTYWQLLERTAVYYYTPLVQVLKTALPPGLLQRSQRRISLVQPCPRSNGLISEKAQQILALLQASPTGDYSWRYIHQKIPRAQAPLAELLKNGWVKSYLRPPSPPQAKQQQAVILIQASGDHLTARQQEILSYLQQSGGELWLQDLLQACQTSKSTLNTLAQKGCITITLRQKLRLEQGLTTAVATPKSLTSAQTQALSHINAATQAQTFLLHGVTGSGKTEVYIQAIRPRLAEGQSALVLVPEIGLTPQMLDRFQAIFGEQVLVYHSALSEGERYDTWRQLLLEKPRLVIGTRSAIFLPLHSLGILVLDEEHDSGYKQEQPSPCYHARTLAQWRSELENCPLILGSATPGLATWQQKLEDKLTYLPLPQRIQARPLPPIEIVDLRNELHQGNRSMFSRTLFSALENLPASGQALLFIHRRGHSTFVSCRSCGQALECPHCSVSLTYHWPDPQQAPVLRCHYCNFSRPQPKQCPSCQSPYLKPFGGGTQRAVQELKERLPDLKVIRFDSDTTQRKGAHRQLLEAFTRQEAQVMIGTQMLTKGMDIENVNLVGILTADGLLHFADFQAGERTFQTLTQVAGRAGRGDKPGRVILQTYTPEHQVIQAVQAYAYEDFAADELQQRQALNYPPYGQLVLIRLSSPDPEAVAQTAQTVSTSCQQLTGLNSAEVDILGPAPAPILKVAQRYRWQILLKFNRRQSGQCPPLPLDVNALRQLCPGNVRLGLDVDPQNFF